MKANALIATLLLLAVCAAASACGTDSSAQVAPLRDLVSGKPEWVDEGELGNHLWSIHQAFYEDRQYVPAWIDGNRMTPQMTALLEALRASERHGLDPGRYGTANFERTVAESSGRLLGVRFASERVAELDARLTYAYLQYAADLLGWSGSPRDVHRDLLHEPSRDEDLAARAARAVTDGGVRESLEELAPTHSQYKGLQQALAAEMENPSGRLETIQRNMERWRWMPRDFGDRYILVNVPAAQLQVMESDTPVLAMRVIVGAPDTPTPLFSDRMTYLVFSPYWNIPESIIRQETLPRVAKDPDYLEHAGIEIVSADKRAEPVDPRDIDWDDEEDLRGIRFRQVPGPENALGLVKFIFPNHFSVYLHDTPDDRPFDREDRALSHGCIRVEAPVALARYVLGDQSEWTDERITEAMHAGTERTVKLKAPLPVHIGYWTAWVNPDGESVTYLGDPYGIDARHAELR